jgi:PadR family transcriptional regulator AphA
MSIRHAILGLLSEKPMHGYRLKEVFAQRVSSLWGLTTGQIYQSLAALEGAGFLESHGERMGRRPARHIYSVTERGRTELAAWLQKTPTAWIRPFRDDLLIRLMFLRPDDVDGLCGSLTQQEREAMLLLAKVTRLRDGAAVTSGTMNVRGMFLDGMTDNLEAHIKLLQGCREEVVRWARIAETDAAPRVAGLASTGGEHRAASLAVRPLHATSIAVGTAAAESLRDSPSVARARGASPRRQAAVAGR